MAHIYGKVGESALQKSLKKREKVLMRVLQVLMLVMAVLGFFAGLAFNDSGTFRYLAFVGIGVLFVLVLIWGILPKLLKKPDCIICNAVTAVVAAFLKFLTLNMLIVKFLIPTV
ncbi:MAG: hypothetical protein IKJ89_08060, partial [Kiritimatiellae bacterium]|nr:hypothetical protein [Kiritimatiellia bacterium]